MSEETKLPEVPTAEMLVHQCMEAGRDRCALVRRPRIDRLTGLAVCMVGLRAMVEVGCACTDLSGVHNLSVAPMRLRAALEAGLERDQVEGQNLPRLFELMEENGCQYLALHFQSKDESQIAGVMLFLGDDFCRELEPKLNALGVLCNINREAV